MLIGNLTRDPEIRYTPSGSAVCTFGLATNRQWNTETGEKKEEVEYHRVVAWNKLGELCGQLLKKGRKVYVEGRLQTRKWAGQDGVERTTTEIVISDMVILDSKGAVSQTSSDAVSPDFDIPEDLDTSVVEGESIENSNSKKGSKSSSDQVEDDIPF